MPSEFDLIRRYFTRPPIESHVALGVGDDCALLQVSPGKQLAVSTDMLVEGRHFFPDVDPVTLGAKALAVNLSDLAAMGAKPLAFTLALALPQANEVWLQAFSAGLFAVADQYRCPLIGGDTTRGPLNICITVMGEVDPQYVLRRDAAKLGDDIWVSGKLGDARLALAHLRGETTLGTHDFAQVAPRLHTPTPRVELGQLLCGIAHAAIDISDGLSGDLGHILTASKVGAHLYPHQLPISPQLAEQSLATRLSYALGGGDDYELCFTAPSSQRSTVKTAARAAHVAVHRIGSIVPGKALQLFDEQEQPIALHAPSFDHFK